MYTTDATRTAAKGKTISGNDSISATFADFFNNNKVRIEIKQNTAVEQNYGTAVARGTYHVSGTSQKGAAIDLKGTYTNTVVKEKGRWKMSKSLLASL